MKYPYHISEYAHSMGNACGNLIDYWEAIESTNFFIGGAIWDWVDQAMYGYDNGNRYFGYGGDFSQDNKPNDGMFCMNGVMRPDLSPKAQYYEVKKVYQNVGVKAVDMKKGLVEIFNKNYFEPLTQYNIQWGLYKDGVLVGSVAAAAGSAQHCWSARKAGVHPALQLQRARPGKRILCESGVCPAPATNLGQSRAMCRWKNSRRVRGALEKAPAVQTLAAESKGKVTTTNEGNFTVVKGEGFTAKFDKQTGSLAALTYGAQTIIREGEGPKLDAFRAPTDNDAGIGYPNAWFQYGLYNLHHKVTGAKTITKKDGTLQLSFTVESQAPEGSRQYYGDRDRTPEKTYSFDIDKKKLGPDDFKFTTNQIYTVYPDGSIELQSAISADRASVVLPRIGYALQLPGELHNYNYYGHGPINNYNDRKRASSSSFTLRP